jgi:hypothetical protein
MVSTAWLSDSPCGDTFVGEHSDVGGVVRRHGFRGANALTELAGLAGLSGVSESSGDEDILGETGGN